MSILHYIPHVIVTSISGGLIWLGKKFIDSQFDRAKDALKSVKDFVVSLRDDLTHIKNIQGVQAENHLKTIQDETIKTNELLSDMRVQNAETNGYLKAIVEKK